MSLLINQHNIKVLYQWSTYIKAGPIGLEIAIASGKMALGRWAPPKESQEIQAKNPIQHSPDTVKVDTMVALFHVFAVLPPS